MSEPLRYEVADHIATVTLDRPDALNGIDEAMLGALPEAMARVRDDASVKALVITGASIARPATRGPAARYGAEPANPRALLLTSRS